MSALITNNLLQLCGAAGLVKTVEGRYLDVLAVETIEELLLVERSFEVSKDIIEEFERYASMTPMVDAVAGVNAVKLAALGKYSSKSLFKPLAAEANVLLAHVKFRILATIVAYKIPTYTINWEL